MRWLQILQEQTAARVDYLVNNRRAKLMNKEEQLVYARKQQTYKERNAQIVKTNVKAAVTRQMELDKRNIISYQLQIAHCIKQNDYFYVEEHLEEREAVFRKNQLISDRRKEPARTDPAETLVFGEADERVAYHYDRRAAVQYAEQWWNGRNPAYRSFDVDCTNYISQCLRAGGAPMTGQPSRGKGWWYSGNSWSYSWAVAHSMRWYLSGAKQGLQAKELSSPTELSVGDVICYDFEGDGKWDHTTIVVAKDANFEPLVNAHTNDSRMRYWRYEDSAAWTPEIQYKFFHILSAE